MEKTRRLLVLLLISLVLVISLSGCSAGEGGVLSAWRENLLGFEEETYDLVVVSNPRHSGYEAINDRVAYASLHSDDQRKAYEAIEQSIFQVTTVPAESGGYRLTRAFIPSITAGEVYMIKEAVIADHPEAFWVRGEYEYGHNLRDGDYVTLFSEYTYADILARKELLEQNVARVLREIPGDLTEYDRELAVHDCLVGEVCYDSDADTARSEDFFEASTSYGALVNRMAVCTGYSRAAKLLLNRLGISCSMVNGVSNGVGHIWNIVRINGEWYHLDVTWDDPVMYSTNGIAGYDYFNVPDEYITADHEIAQNYDKLIESLLRNQNITEVDFYNFDLPQCTSLEANFYKHCAVEIGELSREGKDTVEAALRRNSTSGERYLYLSFPTSMDGDVVSEWMEEALREGRSRSNARGGRQIGEMEYMERSDDAVAHWRNVYCIRLTFTN